MGQPENLKTLSQLRDRMFGQPYPRHGLILLWWFAHECVEIDSNRMRALCDPEDRDFGFHLFHNSEDLLPDSGLQYYELGNLHYPGAMPEYVRKNYDRHVRESNADRIVVLVSSEYNVDWFEGIYVTHHLGKGRFDENETYRISQRLIRAIKRLDWADFIRKVRNRQ